MKILKLPVKHVIKLKIASSAGSPNTGHIFRPNTSQLAFNT